VDRCGQRPPVARGQVTADLEEEDFAASAAQVLVQVAQVLRQLLERAHCGPVTDGVADRLGAVEGE
jgi:hypothetical protein